MTAAKIQWQRGERIAAPSDFRPTDTHLTPNFNLYFDYEHGYLKQIARRPGDPTPHSYYRLVKVRSARSLWRRGWLAPLRFGLLGVALASLALIIYPLYPGVAYQIERQVNTTVNHTQALAALPPQVSATNRVIIPKLGVDTNILEGPNLDILNREDGVWHQTGTLQSGNFVMAGHRFKYLPPNTSTLYNLAQLTAGDTIIVDWYRTRYIYVVDSQETVKATQVSILNQTGGPRLTIYTCTNSAQTKRTVVHAHLQL